MKALLAKARGMQLSVSGEQVREALRDDDRVDSSLSERIDQAAFERRSANPSCLA